MAKGCGIVYVGILLLIWLINLKKNDDYYISPPQSLHSQPDPQNPRVWSNPNPNRGIYSLNTAFTNGPRSFSIAVILAN